MEQRIRRFLRKRNYLQRYGLSQKYVGCYEDNSVYSGYGWNRNFIGSCRDGIVYKGYGWNKIQVGSYTDGCIYFGYGWNKKQIGTYCGPDGATASAALLLLFSNF